MQVWDHGHGIYAFDSGYLRPMLDAVHLVRDGNAVAVIDTGTEASVPRVLEALGSLGLTADDVRYVILTHVHLDHAAGAGALMARCPQAQLIVHPRGARHMIDPRKLWAASAAVYGEAYVREAYGVPLPVDTARVVEASHGARFTLGARELTCLDSPGHARHHLVVHDSRSGNIFTGDVFGLSYRELDFEGRAFIVPTSSPSQFDPAAAHESIEMILSFKPTRVYLTHFSEVGDVPRLGAIMHRLIDSYATLAERCRGDGEARYPRLLEGMRAIVLDEAHRQGLPFPDERIVEVLQLDIELNAQGLVSYLDARDAAAAKAANLTS